MSRRPAGHPRHPVRRTLSRGLAWVLARVAVVAVAVAVAPVTVIAAGSAAYAWWRGWPPRRVYAAAAWCLPMAVAWLIAIAAWPLHLAAGARRHASAGPGYPPGVGPGSLWLRVLAAPYRAWLGMWRLAEHGHLAGALVAVAPAAVPLGIAAGGLGWAYRGFRMRTGAGGLTPAAPAAFDARQWRHQVRTARALSAAPGALPLLSRRGHVIVGAAIRAVGHRTGQAAAIPYERLRSHQVVIGSTGTGKTTLLLRLWAGFMAAGLRRYAAGTGRRPLLVVLDCKGGGSSRKVADRTRRVLRDAGARSTAIWPDEAALSLWRLPPGRLVTTLLDLIELGSGGAAYYTDVMEALVSLAVHAPPGPPAGAGEFLARLDADFLAAVYGASGDGEAVAAIRSAARAFNDVRLRFQALWRRLGAGLDGGASFADADAWYCILEGTAEATVAEAQARALTDLLAYYARGGEREILLCVDEFSAVSRRLPIWRLYERARSLGLAVQVSAQSWEGLARTEDERQRVAATAEGGIWLLRTPRPGPVTELAGTRSAVETTRRLDGLGAWPDAGLSRTRLVPVLDGDLVRRFEVGQVAYVYRGGVTYLQIKRLTGKQAAIGRGLTVPVGGDAAAGRVAGDGQHLTLPAFADRTAGPVPWPGSAAGPVSLPVPGPAAGSPVSGPPWVPAARPAAAAGSALPDVSEVLDEAFGARHE